MTQPPKEREDGGPIQLMELLGMSGTAQEIAKIAKTKRERSWELEREFHQLTADAEALERAARALTARSTVKEGEDGTSRA